MTVDYDTFRAKQENAGKKQSQVEMRERQLSLFLQAGVSAERLTHNDDWDKFLGYLESAYERTKDARASTLERLAGPEVVGVEEFYRNKYELTRFASMVETLEWVMSLPKTLIENGEAARDLLPEARKAGEAT